MPIAILAALGIAGGVGWIGIKAADAVKKARGKASAHAPGVFDQRLEEETEDSAPSAWAPPSYDGRPIAPDYGGSLASLLTPTPLTDASASIAARG